jgi:hypothetical protein
VTNIPTHPTLEDALGRIVGHALSSITFVADYVQFAFDGPGLTAYTPPTVSLGSQYLEWEQAGYRDALCRQIGRRVERVEVDERHVAILFDGGAALSISLLDKDYTGPEALEFSLNSERNWVL